MDKSTKRVGFIGIGMMGCPMAHRLHESGYRLIVFDSIAAQAQRFVKDHPNAVIAGDLGSFADVDVVVLMAPGSSAVDSIVFGQSGRPGLANVLPTGATIIDMSSSEPLRSRDLSAALEKRGLHFLDAPVSGGVKCAVDGSLAIMVGGSGAHLETHRGLLQSMGKSITHVGGAGAGHAMKALNNYVSAAGLVAAAEALWVGQRFGLDPAVMTDVFNSSTGKNNTTENKVKPFMLSGEFNSGFALSLMAKDVSIAVGLGDAVGHPMDFGTDVLRIWESALETLGASADHTEMYRFLQK